MQAQIDKNRMEVAQTGPIRVDVTSGLSPEAKRALAERRDSRGDRRKLAFEIMRKRDAAEEQAKVQFAQQQAEQAPIRMAMQMMMNGTPEQAQAASQMIQSQMHLQGQMAGSMHNHNARRPNKFSTLRNWG